MLLEGGFPHPNQSPAGIYLDLPCTDLAQTLRVYNIALTGFTLMRCRKCLMLHFGSRGSVPGVDELTSASCVSAFRQPGTWPVAVLGG